ncbi:aspartate racemase [Saccharopolyspora kobensis]|uniref:Aspartate racemase n=1 Tax=Saccharopolyspora kobensis TaxID=146035 RepID=A0A1H6DQ02_9PSEU|nr:aspartate/glutamate racemase family protein [Saccharopolyspora kobensis]SEG86736.1 aspartate racemase [Saccharopolyspora kobensis]SFF00612.1 aspartate racemase [Saccharopolyspora kobensis]
MRTIGMLGGMSWESSAEYYRLLNEGSRGRLGGHRTVPTVLFSVDFAEVAAMQEAGAWEQAGAFLADAARRVQRAGADLIVLCTNTMHQVADTIEKAVDVPFAHIVDATAQRIAAAGHRKVGLLGTRYTMELDFYRARMRDRHGIEVVVPSEPDRTLVHDVIYRELTRNRVEDGSRAQYVRVIRELADRGAEAVVLGCTEITLLIGQQDSPLPLFDSTRLHVEHVLDLALS